MNRDPEDSAPHSRAIASLWILVALLLLLVEIEPAVACVLGLR
jgi:hypothetical protein